MKIGELARLAQCSVETVRYYEKAGLLPPAARSGANYRHYGDAHVARLRFIRNCRELEMTLEEIRTLVHLKLDSERDCGEVNVILDAHVAHVTQRISRLEKLRQQLLTLRGLCDRVQPRKSCAILLELAEPVESDPAEEKSGDCVAGAHGGCAKTHSI